MKPSSRDGVWTVGGLSADFRFVIAAPGGVKMTWVETVTGQHCAPDSQLNYDPIRDLTPEAAALVEQTKEAMFQGVLGKLADKTEDKPT